MRVMVGSLGAGLRMAALATVGLVGLGSAGAAVAQIPAELARFDAAGPFTVQTMSVNGFTLFVPQPLGANGFLHPVLTWGNGTGASPNSYAGLLRQFASHGIVVVASTSSNTGTGNEMRQGISLIFDANQNPSSVFFGTINPIACASGHSQGGGGTVNTGADSRVVCTVPIEPDITFTSSADGGDLLGPTLLLCGSNDGLAPCPPNRNASRLFNDADQVMAIFATLQGVNHFEPVGDGGGFRGYATAFLVANMFNDPAARSLFFGTDANCGICNDPNFVVVRNFEGVDVADGDGDGVADGIDNCPLTPNPDQNDNGGLANPIDTGGAQADGIGDACQCGDVNNDGRVTGTDGTLVARSALGLAPFPGVMNLPGFLKCDVGGAAGCESTDATLIKRAAIGLPPGVNQACTAATGQ